MHCLEIGMYIAEEIFFVYGALIVKHYLKWMRIEMDNLARQMKTLKFKPEDGKQCPLCRTHGSLRDSSFIEYHCVSADRTHVLNRYGKGIKCLRCAWQNVRVEIR